jgi:uncharacterized protein involved in exopolysaccharide biosynthesis
MTQLDQTHPSNSSKEITVDLKELFALLWGGRKVIILTTSVVALCTIFYALSLTNYYKSSTTLSMMHTEKSMTMAGVGGLVSFAGINLSSEMSKGAMIVNTINSRSFVKHLVSFDDVLPSIMAAKSYDSETKKLVFDPDIYDATNKEWLEGEPNYLKAYNVYRGIITIDFHDVRNIIYLEAEHISPIFAQELLTLIIREADMKIRQTDVQRANEAIAYLTSALATTALTEIRNSITSLMQRQLEQKMRGGINSNFVINVIDPPFIPISRSKPSRSLICLVGLFFGFVVGVFWVVLRNYYAPTQIKQTSGP